MGVVSAIASGSISVAGRRTGAKTTPKKRKTTIVPLRFRSKGQSRSKCCLLCRWNFLVHRPRNAVPAGGRYFALAALKSRRAAPEGLPECDAGGPVLATERRHDGPLLPGSTGFSAPQR